MIQPAEVAAGEVISPHQAESQSTVVTLPTTNSVGLIYDLLLEIQLPQTTKENRDKAQNRLKSLSQFAVQHARDISEVASAVNLPTSDRVKVYATIYFKGHVTKSLKKNWDSSNQLFELAEITMNLLVSRNIDTNLKVHLQEALTAILSRDRKVKNNVKVAEGLFESFLSGTIRIDQVVAGQAGLPQHCEPCGVIRLMNSFLQEMPSERSLQLLQTCQPLLMKFVATDFFSPLYSCVQQSADVAASSRNFSHAEYSLQMLSVWLQLMLSLLKKYNKANFVEGLAFFASCQPLSVVLRSTLMLCANTTTLTPADATQPRAVTTLIQHSESQLLVPINGDTSKMKNLLNQVASKTLHFYKVVWQYLWLLKPADIFNGENAFIVDAHYFFRQLLDTLTFLPHVSCLETVLDSSEVCKMVIKAMELLQLFCTEPEFKDVFAQERQNIFLQIIVPFLKISETEREKLRGDPKEFCHAIEDVCGDQKSSTVKTQTAKLLGRLCEKVPGFYDFQVTFCMDAISRSLKDHLPTNLSFTANSPDETMVDNPATTSPAISATTSGGDQSQMISTTPSAAVNNPETAAAATSSFSDPELEQIISKYNMKFASPVELIEVCLVCLSATAYMLEKNRDMHSAFDTFMFNNIDKILQDKSQDILVRQRASLLCSFTLDLLYQTFTNVEVRNTGLDLILTCLIDQIQVTKRQKVLAIQAIETLQMTVGDDVFGERVQINFDWVLDRFTGMAATLNLPDFFDYLVNFVSLFHNSFTESNLNTLLTVLVQRILSDHQDLQEVKKPKKTLDLRNKKVTKTKKSTKGYQFRIAKCWSLLRYVAEHDHFVDRMIPVIEQCSLPLLQFLQNPEEVDFDDDLIFFISSLLKKAKSTDSPILQQAFQFLPKFLAKFNYIFGPLLECISYYTLYSRVNTAGVDWLATSQEHLETLFSMVKQSFFPPTPQSSPLDEDQPTSYAIEGALVLQMMFQNLNGAPLLNYLVTPTVTLIFDKLAERKPSQTMKRQLILTLLCCTLHNSEMTLEAIDARGGKDQLLAFFKQLVSEQQSGAGASSAAADASCSHKKLKSAYELKIYSIALTNMIFKSTGNQSTDSIVPRPMLLRHVIFALIRQQRSEQRILAKASAQKQKKKDKNSKSTGLKKTLISQMVDNILQEGAEVGYSSGDNDADLSGDDVKTPIFVIKKDNPAARIGGTGAAQQQEESADMMHDDDVEVIGGGDSDEELFVQEEYDLASNLDQVATRMDSFDEFKYFTEQARLCHQGNAAFFQSMVSQGLSTEKQKEYFKAILQSHRVVLETSGGDNNGNDPSSISASNENNGGNVPRRIVKVKRTTTQAATMPQ